MTGKKIFAAGLLAAIQLGMHATAATGTSVTKDSAYSTSSPMEANAKALLDVRFISPFKARDNTSATSGTPKYTQLKTEFKPAELSIVFDPSSSSSALESVLKFRIRDVLDRAHLCNDTASGASSSTDAYERLKECAKYHPDEFSTASNILQPYMEWRQSEMLGIMSMYEAKLTSPNMGDRIEGRYVIGCVLKHYGEDIADGEKRDISTALTYCTDPDNWDFESIFPKLDKSNCTDGALSGTTTLPSGTLFVFDSQEFIRNCVANEQTAIVDSSSKLAEGLDVAIGMLPYTRMEISKVTDGGKTYADIKIKTYPMAMSTQQLYDTLFLRAEKILMNGSQGCVPSPFIPTDVVQDAISSATDQSWMKYCSIIIPAGLTEKVKETGAEMAPFFWSRAAKKIAQIQTLEVLNGATLVAQESFRVLNAADTELGFLTAGTAEIMRAVTKTYKDSIDLAVSSKLEDVLNGANKAMTSTSNNQNKVNEAYRAKLTTARNRLSTCKSNRP